MVINCGIDEKEVESLIRSTLQAVDLPRIIDSISLSHDPQTGELSSLARSLGISTSVLHSILLHLKDSSVGGDKLSTAFVKVYEDTITLSPLMKIEPRTNDNGNVLEPGQELFFSVSFEPFANVALEDVDSNYSFAESGLVNQGTRSYVKTTYSNYLKHDFIAELEYTQHGGGWAGRNVFWNRRCKEEYILSR